MNYLADKIIRYSFYLLFFLIPLFFYPGTSELFEYNKMMLTYGFTIIIVGFWLIKIIPHPNWSSFIRRTPFDLPILLYLGTHLLSTIFSIDRQTSIWGYYSRFHEGFLATVSYILLYYALVSNFSSKDIRKLFLWSFTGAALVSIYGILEHFGHSFSCSWIPIAQAVERPETDFTLTKTLANFWTNFNNSCWVQDVTSRVFATLGQPNWMAAYLDIIILSAIGFLLSKKQPFDSLSLAQGKPTTLRLALARSGQADNLIYLLLIGIYFTALLFTQSRSGFLGLAAGLAVFITAIIFFYRSTVDMASLKKLGSVLLIFSFITLSFGLPFPSIKKYSLVNFWKNKDTAPSAKVDEQTPATSLSAPGTFDVYESGNIRKIVWTGAFKVWQRYPIIGSGVETFAFAYYLDRPIEHNLVSEWEFLYNKAHNEFLNMLATTGTLGFLAYLALIGSFIIWCIKNLISKNPNHFLISGFLSAYIAILVTNFFGFSVVIIGLFFFLIPACAWLFCQENEKTVNPTKHSYIPLSTTQWIMVSVIIVSQIYAIGKLKTMWDADRDFAFGKNLYNIGQYPDADKYLYSAITKDPSQSVFKDQFALNSAILATALHQQDASGSATLINKLAGDAVKYSNEAISQSPNNVTFYKNRASTFYQLSSIDQNNLQVVLDALVKAIQLSPTEPKLQYNLGTLLARIGQTDQAIKILENAILLKKDYSDPRYALGIVYDDLGQKDKARQTMQDLLKIVPDARASQWLEENK